MVSLSSRHIVFFPLKNNRLIRHVGFVVNSFLLPLMGWENRRVLRPISSDKLSNKLTGRHWLMLSGFGTISNIFRWPSSCVHIHWWTRKSSSIILENIEVGASSPLNFFPVNVCDRKYFFRLFSWNVFISKTSTDYIFFIENLMLGKQSAYYWFQIIIFDSILIEFESVRLWNMTASKLDSTSNIVSVTLTVSIEELWNI